MLSLTSPRHTSTLLVTPESVRAERAGQTIDHQPVEDMRSEDSVVIDGDEQAEDDSE